MMRLYAWYTSWSDNLLPIWRARRLFMLGSAAQGVTEYVVILALVAILVIAATLFLGGRISNGLTTVGAQFASPNLVVATPFASWTPLPTASPSSTSVPTATPLPTLTPRPTATTRPTATPRPTRTPKPTATPRPTRTPRPTKTPKP